MCVDLSPLIFLRPSIAVDALGRGAISFTLAGPNFYPSAAYVPFSGFGDPVNGPLLYNVTALSGGRNGPDDLYADVDATRSFDYVLGSNNGGSSC